MRFKDVREGGASRRNTKLRRESRFRAGGSNGKPISSLVCVLLVLTLFGTLGTIANPHQWNIYVLDSEGNVGQWSSITVDGSNRPHISYKSDGGGLKYAKSEQGGWVFEMVDPASNVGRYTSIALDGDDRPHICYWDENSLHTKFAERTDTGWVLHDVDWTGWNGWCSVAFDSTDTPHLGFLKSENLELVFEYAKWTGSSWDFEKIDENGAGYYNSIVVDSTDTPHVSYMSGGNHRPMYAIRTGNQQNPWQVEEIEPGAESPTWTSIDIDSGDIPHVSYAFGPASELRYAKRTGTPQNPWIIETADSDGDVDGWNSLDVGGDDIPRISYHQTTGHQLGHLKYAERTGSLPDPWHTETVDSSDTVGFSNSIAVDDDLCPHISYFNYGNPSLMYANACEPNQAPVANFTWDPDPGYEGESIQFTDLSTDSDGTIESWQWTFEYLNPSTDQHPIRTYGDNGVFQVTLEVTDDEGATDNITKDVTVLNNDPVIDYINSTIYNNTQRTQGYWNKQCDFGPGNPPPSEDHVGIKQEYIDFIAANSDVWSGITTKDPICDDLDYHGNKMIKKLRQQLIAVWLNIAANFLFMDSPLHDSRTTATSVREFIEIAEDVILNHDPKNPDPRLEDLKDVADQINNDPPGGWIATDPSVGVYEAKVTDPGSDDLTFVWSFDGGSSSRQEIVIYYNDGMDDDPYPSPWGTYPFTVIDVQIIGYAMHTAHLNPNLYVEDDDGGYAVDEDPGEEWSADWTFEFEVSSRTIEFGFTIYDVQITYLDWDSVVKIIDPWEHA